MRKRLLSLAVIAVGITLVTAQSIKNVVSNKGKTTQTKVVEMQIHPTTNSTKSMVIKKTSVLRNKIAFHNKKMNLKRMAILRNISKKHSNRITNFKTRTPLLKMKASADTTFFEGFEGYNGTSNDWIPTNWTELNKTSVKYVAGDSINPTWAANAGNDYAAPAGGNSMAWVDWDDVPRKQDVWLVSPALTPKSGDYLNFNFFYNPLWMYIDWNLSTETSNVFNFTKPNATMQMYVSTNNGSTWTMVWDAIEDAGQFDATSIEDWAYSAGSWNTIQKSLEAYAGKPIKIAFRYVGTDGDSMGLDEISIRQLIPSAFYSRPQGYFFLGLTTDFSNAASDYLLGHAYEPATWFNYSNEESKSFVWNFEDPKTSSNFVSTDVDAVVTYPAGEYKVPTLVATAGTRDSSYTWGTSPDGAFFAAGGSTSGLGAGNYDLNEYIYDYPADTLGNNYLFGNAPDSTIDAIANYFEKPVHRYLIDSVWISLSKFSAPVGTEFKLIVHRVTDNGLADTIATAVCKAEDVITIDPDSHTMLFEGFTSIDSITGLVVINDYLEINDAILVELTGFNKKGVTLAAYAQGYDSPIGESNAYIFYNSKDSTGAVSREIYNASDYIGAYTSLLFNLGATYSYIQPNENTFVAPIAGGNKTFNVDAWYSPIEWWLDAELPSWLTSEQTFNETTFAITYTLKAAPLPIGVTGRGTQVKVFTHGADMTINVSQGDYTGLLSSKVSSTKVISNSNSFDLTYASDFKSVSIYNVSGQLISNYNLPATGKLSVSAINFKKGLYLFKFQGNNTETTKVIR